ncbi:retinol dehydrogenase 12-like [Diabrotica virgifera virgifera]|uniref:Retinol dehydrogenase 12-like n=1 Tax=Diabrotica virgifera virgifera TaxID=50390 RepID=A0A6P7GLC0_DIAVI|nr:retinol dehydrogenase 12-like [Diabrotica virgifera virgifera]
MWLVVLLSIFGCILSIVVLFLFLLWLYVHFEYVACTSDVCLVGKTALVTGGSKGIGYDIVLQLASRGCKVIIASRTIDEKLRQQIIWETNNPNIVLEHVNMSSFKSVRQLASRLNESESKLDILINNAGIPQCLDVPTEDGLNETMQVNHFSAFLLTHLLVDLLKKSAGARVIFTGSFLSYFHMMSRVSVRDFKIENAMFRIFDYPNSKFCNIISADMFAVKLKRWNITCNSYQPGIVKTEIFNTAEKELKSLFDILLFYSTIYLFAKFGVKTRVTSQGAVQIATSKEFENVTGNFVGRYFNNVRPRAAYDAEFCQAIWRASEEMVRLNPEEKLDYSHKQ